MHRGSHGCPRVARPPPHSPRSKRPPANCRADARENCSRASSNRRESAGGAGPAGRGGHEDAKRNPLSQERQRRTSISERRPACKRRRGLRLDRLTGKLSGVSSRFSVYKPLRRGATVPKTQKSLLVYCASDLRTDCSKLSTTLWLKRFDKLRRL